MSHDPVILEVNGIAATVTLNRPDVHNAFDDDMIARLRAVWDDLAGREDVRVVVLRGAGKNFSAGGDLNWMKRAASYDRQRNYEDGLALAEMLYKLDTLPQLTIACVKGAAMGGGMGLACCADIVLATTAAHFALSEVRLGLVPATIGPYVLAAIGARQARRYFQTGEAMTAEDALRLGLVHELYEHEGALEKSLVIMLDSVRKNGPQAMVAAKSLSRNLQGQGMGPDVSAMTAQLIADTRAGDEAREGLSAFLEKRLPSWGR